MKQKTFRTSSIEELDQEVNKFGETHEIKASQIRPVVYNGSTVIIIETVWYEDDGKPYSEKIQDAAKSEELVCVKCNRKISEKVRKYSKDKYGKELCMDCQ